MRNKPRRCRPGADTARSEEEGTPWASYYCYYSAKVSSIRQWQPDRISRLQQQLSKAALSRRKATAFVDCQAGWPQPARIF